MFEQVKDMLVNELTLAKNVDEITMSTELEADLGFSSLDTADLILLCEEKFDIEIGDEDYRGFVTVGDIVNYLSSITE